MERIDDIKDRLDGFLNLKPNWNSYEADIPSKETVELSKNVIDILEKLFISVKNAKVTADASITVEFDGNRNVRYEKCFIEIYDDGDIVVYKKFGENEDFKDIEFSNLKEYLKTL